MHQNSLIIQTSPSLSAVRYQSRRPPAQKSRIDRDRHAMKTGFARQFVLLIAVWSLAILLSKPLLAAEANDSSKSPAAATSSAAKRAPDQKMTAVELARQIDFQVNR